MSLPFPALVTLPYDRYVPGIQESTPQYHHGLAGGLFELHLYTGEFLVDDLDHPLDLLRRYRPCTALFPQQVHHVGRKLVASLKITGTRRLIIPAAELLAYEGTRVGFETSTGNERRGR